MDSMCQATHTLNVKKRSVYIFPEGTRDFSAEKLLPFKKGPFYLAVAAQVPLVPIIAAPYNKKILNIENGMAKAGAVIPIEVLSPIPTQGLGPDDVPALMEQTYHIMQSAYERVGKESDRINSKIFRINFIKGFVK